MQNKWKKAKEEPGDEEEEDRPVSYKSEPDAGSSPPTIVPSSPAGKSLPEAAPIPSTLKDEDEFIIRKVDYSRRRMVLNSWQNMLALLVFFALTIFLALVIFSGAQH